MRNFERINKKTDKNYQRDSKKLFMFAKIQKQT